jgi:hypothetical protein
LVTESSSNGGRTAVSGEKFHQPGTDLSEGKKRAEEEECWGFIGRVLMAINSRDVSGDGELRPATVSVSREGERG